MSASLRKTDKELAYLYDLFIAPDWGERFAELIDEHVSVPNEGNVAYLAAATGSHAMSIQERAGEKLKLLCFDENEDCLELARAKAKAANEATEFLYANLERLPPSSTQFDVVIADASLISANRIRVIFGEMVRVAKHGATVALALPTASSFGEFFSIYWEALHNCGLLEHESDVEHLIMAQPTISDIEEMAKGEDLVDVGSWTRVEEFDYDSAEQFLNAPLVADFLMQHWLASVPEDDRDKVSQEIARLINEDRHEGEFALSVKATLVTGRKAHDN